MKRTNLIFGILIVVLTVVLACAGCTSQQTPASTPVDSASFAMNLDVAKPADSTLDLESSKEFFYNYNNFNLSESFTNPVAYNIYYPGQKKIGIDLTVNIKNDVLNIQSTEQWKETADRLVAEMKDYMEKKYPQDVKLPVTWESDGFVLGNLYVFGVTNGQRYSVSYDMRTEEKSYHFNE